MARKSSSPKRKRASLPLDASQQQPIDGNEADVEENPRPKKRGRPRRSIDVEQEAEAEPAQPKKRGRPSLGGKAATAPGGAKTNKKRGRPAGAEQEDGENTIETTRRRKGRPPATEQDGEDAGAVQKRKGHKAAAQEKVQDEPPPTKPGRKKKSRVSVEQPEKEQPTKSTKRRRGRPSLQEADGNTNSSKAKAADTSEPNQRKRPRNQPAEEGSAAGTSYGLELFIADAPPIPASLPHLAPRTRKITRSTLDTKWDHLLPPSIAVAVETLKMAQPDVEKRIGTSDMRRAATEVALHKVTKTITRGLHRIPFPPAAVGKIAGRKRRRTGHEAELDYESVLHATEALGRQLDPALHAVELLKREKTKIEKELEKDYATLRNLEAGARGEGRQRKERMRKMHVLAPEKREERGEQDMVFEQKGAVPVFKDLEDGEVKDLALQLGGHVESIRTNMQQAEGLGAELAGGRAALRSVLSRHLDAEQYDRVVFG